MSWKTLNEIIGLAAIDENFCQNLLQSPIATIDERGYILTEEERALLSSMHTTDLREFCARLIAELADK